ncbi:ADAM 17-like protease isoform X1 [Sitophilus oryzae]|uniref:ADAM 17-like protease isoform X1 n=1 Tax=Sitophilus oryzae TaxID=7048 RepID=A0A6J2X4V6_SITOR|nr:ADAM 17-like protease isoform X1 [Sitophilus oryzae]XP_030746203.1 ADAM 17-like protease isoform X1 [Sitophilus oryzae]
MALRILTLLILSAEFFLVWGSIHKNLKYFQIIHADDLTHKIVKRGIQESSHPFNRIKEVHLRTHGKDFRIILSPKRSILHSKFKAYSVNGDGEETHIPIDHDSFFEGRVFGETNSHVNMHIEDGVMTGNIHMPDDIYHIEPSWRHIPDHDNKTMITYKQSDIKFSWDPSNLPDDYETPRMCAYVKEGAELEENDTDHHIAKRQIDQYEYKLTKTRCPLLLVADYRFFQEMGGSNTKTTINYLISLIDRVHKIYNDTIWQDRQEVDDFKGMGFVIKKIVVHNEPTRIKSQEAHYNMNRGKWDVRNLLEAFSSYPQDEKYCLAHLFTHQTFKTRNSVVLGLAYIASPRVRQQGGICSNEYFKNGYTLYLNSGLSSSRNHYGQRVITREADLVTAHEFGHNWGSEHDPDIPECSPSASQGGSYLMYTYSVSGYDVNNKRFSPCSLRSIRKVLQAKSERCFSQPEESFCGNLRVEGDEECDAGLLGTEDNDACCDKDCKLRPKAVCSDKNSPCCQNCQYMRSGFKCRDAQYATCEEESTCTGHSSDCPKSPPMQDGTNCQEKGKCKGGKCIPYCETQGLQSCMCDIIENACKRCCRSSMNETCSPVESTDILADGTPCIQGFCNNGHCEKTVQDVVERFWDIIEDININKVLLFLRDNIVGTVVLITAFLWIPASCIIGYIDRKKRREELKRWEWRNSQELIHGSEKVKNVIKLRVPNRPNITKQADQSPAKQSE